MKFTTYTNTANPHVTIHRNGCGQIRKRGGEHQFGQGGYQDHVNYEEAFQYAESTGLPIRDCSFCRPK